MALHPLLWAVLPVLFLYARNAQQLEPVVVVRPVIAALLAAVLLLALLRLALRDLRRAALVSTVCWQWFFGWGLLTLIPALGQATAGAGWPAKVLWGLALPAAVIATLRLARGRELATTSRLLGVAGLGLVLLQVATAAPVVWQQAHRTYALPPDPIHLRRPAGRLPNIYWIVLDGYARGDILQRRHGYSNERFLGFLRSKGFVIADRASANYSCTLMSLPATLNMDYLDPLVEAEGPDSGDMKAAIVYTEHNRLIAALKGVGYRTVSYYCGWTVWEMPHADVLDNQPLLTDFERAALAATPLAQLGVQDEFELYRQRTRYTLAHLGDPESLPGPVFVLAHVLCPHPPFVFTRTGAPRNSERSFLQAVDNDSSLPDRIWSRRYADQVEYLNTLVMPAVERLLARAAPDTIIVIQGDHGPARRGATQQERLAILNAVRLPGGEKLIARNQSPVNTFRMVLNHVFDTRLPPLPNRHYCLNWLRPYLLEPVAAEWLEQPPGDQPAVPRQPAHRGGANG